MKCPKCQAEISSNARFCTKCGCNLATEMAKAVKPSVSSKAAFCVNCGAVLRSGEKFCTKCGQAVGSVANQHKENGTMFENRTHRTPSAPDEIVLPVNREQQKQKELQSTEKPQKGQKSIKGLVIVAVVLLVLVAASGITCVMIWNGALSLPAIADGNTKEKGSSIKEELEIDSESAIEEVDKTDLFAEAEVLLAEGKNQITVEAEIINGMENIRNAMNQFAEKAQEAGDTSIAADRIADAYASYVDAITRHKDLLSGQELSGSIYSQIMSEINEAEALAEEMSAEGYTVDTTSLTTMKDAFVMSYTERVINEFNRFTNRADWSRTEAWNLMSGFDGMFDNSDLDNPLRLRYAYALSWWIQKQIETELTNGTITEKGAAIKIANLIEAMDYNPMMISYYISYMNKAGENCKQVSDAYDEIMQHLAVTQGIRIGENIDLKHFWYFNDFGIYSVDDSNGVTSENRQWIRDRMNSVVFVQ